MCSRISLSDLFSVNMIEHGKQAESHLNDQYLALCFPIVLCFSPVKLFESIRRFDHYTAVIISDLQI